MKTAIKMSKLIMSNLPAIDDFLIEDTKFIANTVTIGSQTQWSHGVQETGWKPAHEKSMLLHKTMHYLSHSYARKKCEKMLTGKAAQATIPQTSIFLHVLQFLHVQTQLQRTAEHNTD